MAFPRWAGSRRHLLESALIVAMAVVLLPAGHPFAEAGQGPCAAGSVLNVVAHEDDDLLFSGAALGVDISAGKCVRTVYVTAGNDNLASWYWLSRESGVRAAYAQLAGVPNVWSQSTPSVNGHPVTLATLAGAAQITLMFLHLPDGQMDGSGDTSTYGDSLQKLMQGLIPKIHTVDRSSTYSKAQLVSTLQTIMTDTAADTINTLDYVDAYGDGDHSDHYAVADLANLAQAADGLPHTFTGYLGYGIVAYPPNLSGAVLAAKSNAFFTYGAYDWKTCNSASTCATRPEGSWLSREYPVGAVAPSDPPPPLPRIGPSENVAPYAAVTASSENRNDGQLATDAVDGVSDGYPGDYTKEWATSGGMAGSWLHLAWSAPVTLDKVVLYDRPNLNDQILAGTLTFSDGSTVAVPALNNDGTATTITFPAETTTSVRLTITAVSGTTHNVGLAEFQAITPPAPAPPTGDSTNYAPSATVLASSENRNDSQLATNAVDGVSDGYPGDYTKEWATSGGMAGSWLHLAWSAPVTLDKVVLYDRPNLNDQILAGTLTFSDGSTVAVPALNNDGTATTITFSARAVDSVRLTVTAVSATTLNIGVSEIQTWGATSG